jgi:hypothetical protein
MSEDEEVGVGEINEVREEEEGENYRRRIRGKN